MTLAVNEFEFLKRLESGPRTFESLHPEIDFRWFSVSHLVSAGLITRTALITEGSPDFQYDLTFQGRVKLAVEKRRYEYTKT
jgi:hypothetical protein